MPRKKLGKTVNCPICGDSYYKAPHEFKYGKKQTCGKTECKTANMSGENNPFWGQRHSEETRRKIREGRAKNPPKGTGPQKGVFKQSPEARAKMSAALEKRWKENRDTMLSYLKRGNANPMSKVPHLRRHRRNFTPVQRREWKDSQCSYCGSTKDLVLDHIIPVFDGGDNWRENCQTLCQPCNLWKTYKIDLPRYQAKQTAPKGLEINPE